MAEELDDLLTRAAQVRDETGIEANTATRVGQLLLDMLTYADEHGFTTEQAVAAFLAASGRGLNELDLPQAVEAGKWYLQPDGIWEARRDMQTNAEPEAGANWKRVVEFSNYGDDKARAALQQVLQALKDELNDQIFSAKDRANHFGYMPAADVEDFESAVYTYGSNFFLSAYSNRIFTLGTGLGGLQTIGYATGAYSIALGRASTAGGAHSVALGYYTLAGSNAGTAMGYRTWAKGGDGTHGQHAGGAGAAVGNVPPDSPGSKPILVEGYSGFNHSNNTNEQGEGHGTRGDRAAILGGVNADVAPGATGTVLTASDGTKVPASFLLNGLTVYFTYKHAAPEFVAMKPGAGYYLRSPNGTYHLLSMNDAGQLLVNGTVLSSGPGGTVELSNYYTKTQSDDRYARAVAVKPDTMLRFAQDAEYALISSGTFSVDASGAQAGIVVRARLGADASAPALPAGFTRLTSATHTPGKVNLYSFCVAANGTIDYYITVLP